MNYVPLYVKTDYSVLTSLIKIDDLIEKALIYNISELGVCDDNLFYVMEFYNKCINNNIKPIIGLDLKSFNILLYAKNYNGYQNLCNIESLKNEGKLDFNILSKYLDNLIIVIPYDKKEEKKKYEEYSSDIFIGYENEDVSNIKNKVYIKKTTYLNDGDDKYIPFLYKINNREYVKNDNILEKEIDLNDKNTTIYFSNLIDIKFEKNKDLLPKYSNDPSFDEKEYLTNLAYYGLKKRLDNKVPQKYLDRLNYELNIISNMGFCNYFLIVWDYVKYAKKNNILVGPGRGSAASSLVSYTLGITDIDPIKYDLLFERFLNPNRVTMPDIDIDFDADKRDDVISYVINKYGSKKVSEIITFSNLLSKQVIRDVARVFEISNYKIDNLISLFEDNKTLKEQLNNLLVKKILKEDSDLRKVYDVSLHLEGLKRHTSVHAAGIIICNYELSNYVPLIKVDDKNVCGYTKDYIEDLGLLKMDFLGLKNLSVVDKTIKRIDNLKLSDIPLDDKKTFDLFNKGLLEGIFQFDSPGMKRFISELKPNCLDDLIAAVALFRPGPIDNIPKFISRKDKKEKIDYIADDLEEILKPTYGIIVYQEQIMQIVRKLALFSYAEADDLRRAISKKKEKLIISYKEKFINGCIKNGYNTDIATKVYDHILKFANYGFNKAHSVAYAILGYKIAYLKANYTIEFMCEILNNYISSSVKTKKILNECKILKIEIKKPSINNANVYYDINDKKIVYPLSMIKGIGTLTAHNIIEERNLNGKFTSYIDFVKRCYKQGRDVIENIILAGLLDDFGYTKKTLIENLNDVINYAELVSDLDEEFAPQPIIKEYEEYESEYLTKKEIELYGFYINNHPTNKYITENSVTSKNMGKYFDKNVKMVLYFERKREINTKKNDKMMFIFASDCFGEVDVTCFPKEYEKLFNIKIPGLYETYGRIEKRYSKYQIIIDDVKKL